WSHQRSSALDASACQTGSAIESAPLTCRIDNCPATQPIEIMLNAALTRNDIAACFRHDCGFSFAF
ncbi:hypothetical protein ACC754_38925, partial [Rhizobium johnstonii]|uniref:hypothetical protein n=1 Tax=Rhizobium johnstonii TaxID=3019933 RepID=UPI003F98011F